MVDSSQREDSSQARQVNGTYTCRSLADLTWSEDPNQPRRGTLKYDIRLQGASATAMFDLGCDLPIGCISESFVMKNGFVTEQTETPISAQVANGVYVQCSRVVKGVMMKFKTDDSAHRCFKQRLDLPVLPIDIHGVDVILSINWGRRWDAKIDLQNDSVVLHRWTLHGFRYSTEIRSRSFYRDRARSVMSLQQSDIMSKSDVMTPKKFAKTVTKLGWYSVAIIRYQRDIYTCQSCQTRQILSCTDTYNNCKNPDCTNVFDLSTVVILPATKEEIEVADSQFDKEISWEEVESHLGVKSPKDRRPPKCPDEQKMFAEFEDVFPIRLPATIPPKRDIPSFIPLVDDAKPHSPPLRKYSIPELRELKIQIMYFLR